jgi:hypothetical protein
MDNLFHQHLDVCQQCREHPMETCAEGWALLKRIVASPLPRPTKYAPDVAPVTSAEPDSGLESVPAVEFDTQPRG